MENLIFCVVFLGKFLLPVGHYALDFNNNLDNVDIVIRTESLFRSYDYDVDNNLLFQGN